MATKLIPNLGGTDYESWINFTPSWTGLVVGNGTQVARYRKTGKTVDVYVKLTLGSTSSLSASLNYFGLPFNVAYTSDGFHAIGSYNDVGTGLFVSLAEINGNNIILSTFLTNATYPAYTRVINTVPFTWTTNDIFWLQLRYEAA